LAFPLLLVLGFTLIFSGPPKPLVQMGVVGELPVAYAPLRAVPVQLVRETLSGRAIRYGDWLLPGVIGMNLMFSGLFGVGFV
ncbi:ABC transporter permease, partial [Aeromonas dhakensis]|nr:ABC transporter permease [Aeromonas dhakensis]